MATKRIPKWTPVIVVWEDAVTVYDPSHSDEDHPTAIRRTIGFLIAKNKKGVSVAMEDDRGADAYEADCQTVTSIPSKMIKQIIRLGEYRES
jgi:hypothetical protein